MMALSICVTSRLVIPLPSSVVESDTGDTTPLRAAAARDPFAGAKAGESSPDVGHLAESGDMTPLNESGDKTPPAP